MIIKIKGTKYLLTGTHLVKKKWYHDIKNISTGEHHLNIEHHRISKYL